MRAALRPAVLLVLCAAGLAWWLARDADLDDEHVPATFDVEAPTFDARSPSLTGQARLAESDPVEAAPSKVVDLPPQRAITGRIVDVSRAPVRDALVWLDHRQSPPWDLTFSDADGAFRLVLLAPAGSHHVGARTADARCAWRGIVVSERGDSVDLGDVVLGEGAAIRGKVTDADGRPVAGVRFSVAAEQGLVRRLEHAGAVYEAGGGYGVSRADGSFEIRGLAPVPHKVRVVLPRSSTRAALPYEVAGVWPGGDVLQFIVSRMGVGRGRVLDDATGLPVRVFRMNQVTVEDPQGRFEVEAPIDGSIEVQARGYLPAAVVDRRLADGGSAEDLEIRLEPNTETGSLRVVAFDPDGARMEGWRLEFESIYSPWESFAPDARGEVVLQGLVVGDHWPLIGRAGWSIALPKASIVEGEETRLEVTLYPGGAVDLRVNDEERREWLGARVEVLDAEGARVPALWTPFVAGEDPAATRPILLSGRTDMQVLRGRLHGLRAGRYAFRIHRMIGQRDVEVLVPESGTTRQEVDLGATPGG